MIRVRPFFSVRVPSNRGPLAPSESRGSVLVIVMWMCLGLVALTYVGSKRWRAAGLDLDGQHPPQD